MHILLCGGPGGGQYMSSMSQSRLTHVVHALQYNAVKNMKRRVLKRQGIISSGPRKAPGKSPKDMQARLDNLSSTNDIAIASVKEMYEKADKEWRLLPEEERRQPKTIAAKEAKFARDALKEMAELKEKIDSATVRPKNQTLPDRCVSHAHSDCCQLHFLLF